MLYCSQGSYDDKKDFQRLNMAVDDLAQSSVSDRLFYLALPSDVFKFAIKAAREVCWSRTGWNRVVIEKPFGRDFDSAMNLASYLLTIIREEEVGEFN